MTTDETLSALQKIAMRHDVSVAETAAIVSAIEKIRAAHTALDYLDGIGRSVEIAKKAMARAGVDVV